jgi:hypothetical protein
VKEELKKFIEEHTGRNRRSQPEIDEIVTKKNFSTEDLVEMHSVGLSAVRKNMPASVKDHKSASCLSRYLVSKRDRPNVARVCAPFLTHVDVHNYKSSRSQTLRDMGRLVEIEHKKKHEK